MSFVEFSIVKDTARCAELMTKIDRSKLDAAINKIKKHWSHALESNLIKNQTTIKPLISTHTENRKGQHNHVDLEQLPLKLDKIGVKQITYDMNNGSRQLIIIKHMPVTNFKRTSFMLLSTMSLISVSSIVRFFYIESSFGYIYDDLSLLTSLSYASNGLRLASMLLMQEYAAAVDQRFEYGSKEIKMSAKIQVYLQDLFQKKAVDQKLGKEQLCSFEKYNAQGPTLNKITQQCHDLLDKRGNYSLYETFSEHYGAIRVVKSAIASNNSLQPLSNFLASKEIAVRDSITLFMYLIASFYYRDRMPQIESRLSTIAIDSIIFMVIFQIVLLVFILMFRFWWIGRRLSDWHRLKFTLLMLNNQLINNEYIKGHFHKSFSAMLHEPAFKIY